MSIKAKQVAGVTSLVVGVVMALSAYHMATLVRLNLEDTASRGQMLANALFLRASEVVGQGGADPYQALQQDGGIKSILRSASAFSNNVGYVAIVNKDGVAIAHSFDQRVGMPMPQQGDFLPLSTAPPVQQLRAVYSDQDYEINYPMVDEVTNQVFGTIKIGVSMTLLRSKLRDAMRSAAGAVLVALILSSLVAMLLSQWMLRPIHVIQSGLSRLGRGELDVTLDLKEQEFRDLGSSFEAVSAQLAALGRGATPATDAKPGGATSDLESVMDNLEDAVALFSPSGELIFCNKAMNALHARAMKDLAADNPMRQIVERTIAGRKSQGPISASFPDPASRMPDPGAAAALEAAERQLVTHAIEDTNGRFLGAMLVARNIGYMSQVQSTLNYSRKLAALGRLMAGVAHEVKNPLNAMTIHLELLRQKLQRQLAVPVPASVGLPDAASRIPDPGLRIPDPGLRIPDSRSSPPPADVTKHVDVISKEIRRLDEVLNGFLKFARPDELKLQPVHLASLVSEITTAVAPEAEQRQIVLKSECPDSLPEINADPGMLSQALLNLALNACQAMPNGGTLKLSCRATSRARVEIDVEDTGVGIAPENLKRIFDLYFTTKEKGSGIGLSMVYRIVQLHDGDIEVQSTPGRGTRFRLVFPQA